MKRKKLFSLLIIFVMLLSACGGGSGSPPASKAGNKSPKSAGDASNTTNKDTEKNGKTDLSEIIPEKTVELTVYSQLANVPGEMVGWSAEILKERFNVKFNIINEADGTFATRMADGSLGDIVIFGADGDDYLSAVKAGMLYDWEEEDLLQEYGSYIYENMKPALEKNKSLTGGIHGFGHDVSESADQYAVPSYHPDIRWDMYAALDYPKVGTLEDFIPLLEKMVAREPASDSGAQTYGVSLMPDWDGNMVMFVKSTAALYGYDEFGFGLYDTKTQTYEDALREDGMYLRCLKFYNTLYQKGLLDPDSMTQTYDDMIEDYLSGAAFFNIFDWMGSGTYNTPDHLKAGKAMFALAAEDQKNIAYGLNIYGGDRPWAIGADTDYPELCMAIINWFCTPEGKMTVSYGPKGLTWDYDKEGNPCLTELGIQCQNDPQNTKITYGNTTGFFNDGNFQHNNTTWAADAINPETNGETYNWKFWESTQKALPVTDIEKDWRDHTGYPNPAEYLAKEDHISIATGSLFSMAPMSNELNTTWQQVATAIKAGSWHAIYASSDKEFDSSVAAMKKEVNAYGYEDCVAFTKEQAERRKAAEDEVKND